MNGEERYAATLIHGFARCHVCGEETACDGPDRLAQHGSAKGDCPGGGLPVQS